jgi:hypothetical protein
MQKTMTNFPQVSIHRMKKIIFNFSLSFLPQNFLTLFFYRRVNQVDIHAQLALRGSPIQIFNHLPFYLFHIYPN